MALGRIDVGGMAVAAVGNAASVSSTTTLPSAHARNVPGGNLDVEDFEEDGEVEFGSYKDMMESLDEFNEQVETNYSTIKEFNDGEEYRRIMTIKEFEEYKKDWLKDEGYAKGGETISREDIVEVLKDELEDVLEDANQEYEGQDIEGEEVEYKSRDGFIPYTDGGYEYRFFTYGNYLTGSGKSLPTNTLDGELERQEELNLEYGKERFEEEFAAGHF